MSGLAWLEPGRAPGKHIDSAEETLLILQGTVEVTVGNETAQVSEGEMALVPELIPHAIRNIGKTKARKDCYPENAPTGIRRYEIKHSGALFRIFKCYAF